MPHELFSPFIPGTLRPIIPETDLAGVASVTLADGTLEAGKVYRIVAENMMAPSGISSYSFLQFRSGGADILGRCYYSFESREYRSPGWSNDTQNGDFGDDFFFGYSAYPRVDGITPGAPRRLWIEFKVNTDGSVTVDSVDSGSHYRSGDNSAHSGLKNGTGTMLPGSIPDSLEFGGTAGVYHAGTFKLFEVMQ